MVSGAFRHRARGSRRGRAGRRLQSTSAAPFGAGLWAYFGDSAWMPLRGWSPSRTRAA